MITKQKIFVLIMLISLISVSFTKLVSTPLVKHNETLRIKMGQIKAINYPLYNFSKVYSRSLQSSTVDSKNFDLFANACWAKASFVDFQVLQQITWQDKIPLPFVITQIEQIQRMQNMLDVFEYSNHVFVILKTGEIQVYKYIDNQQRLQIVKSIQIFDAQFENKLKQVGINSKDQKRQLNTGYFIGFKQKFVYFISNEYVIKITIEDLKVMPVKGIKNSFNYIENVAVVDEQFFVVLHQFEGIYLYHVDTATLNIEFIQNIKIQKRKVGTSSTRLYKDLAYDKQRSLLFVLQKYQGIFVFDVTQKIGGGWEIQLKKDSINQANCQVIHLRGTELYISCQKSIYFYDTKDWPRNKYISMPNRQLKVNQFAIDGDLVALVGRNMIEVMYLGQVSEYQRKLKIQKLILKNQRFVSAYENGLTVGKYQITQPVVNCQLEANQIDKMVYLQGSYWVQAVTQAQCQQEYFSQQKIQNVNFSQGDHCLYYTDVNIQFYEATQFPVWPIVLSGIIIGLIALGVCLWIAKNRITLDRLKAELQSYQEISKDRQKGGDIQLVQQKQVPNSEQQSDKHDIQ